MVFFNYATMQMAAKIVYYGPGLCGKTTNLHVIYGRTDPRSRGEMVSLETETDRTLFFDLLPLDVGVIGGFKTRLQLYTVPGQVFYNTTRKLVLKGVDGIVFVADSQRPMLEPNKESLKNLRENLAEIGLTLEEVPRVYQYNKRDLANIASVDELNDAINPDRSVEWYESSAMNGTGVFETLKAISKLTLKTLRTKMTSDAKRPSVMIAPGGSGTSGSVPRVQPAPAGAAAAPNPSAATASTARATPPPALPPRERTQSGTLEKLARFSELARSGENAAPPPAAASPGTSPAVPALPRREDDAEVSFGETTPAVTKAVPALDTSMKHVKVRSNVDILSELDKLRKVSTQKPAGASGLPTSGSLSVPGGKPKTSPGMSLDDLLTSGANHKKELSKSVDLGLPKEALGRSKHVTVALRFADESGTGPERTFQIELSGLRDVQKLLLSLRINVQGE